MPLLLLHASIEGRLNGCVQVLLMGAIRAFVTTPAERDELGGVGVSVRRLRLRPAPASLLSLLLCIELRSGAAGAWGSVPRICEHVGSGQTRRARQHGRVHNHAWMAVLRAGVNALHVYLTACTCHRPLDVKHSHVS